MRRTSVSAMALAGALILLPACAQALAQNEETVAGEASEAAAPAEKIEVPDTFIRQIHSNKDSFLTNRVNDLYRYNPTGTVTAEDVTLLREADTARRRGSLLGQYLSFDLDGDGVVTRTEFDKVPATVNKSGKTQLDLAFASSDANADRRLDFAELTAIADVQVEEQTSRMRRVDDSPLMFDLNGDGVVNVEELTEAVNEIAAQPVAEPVRPGSSAWTAQCKMPAISQDAELVVVTGYEGGALSSVAVSGTDVETSTATLKIEPGKKPLYIVAVGFEAMVWNVTGDTGRVERFVMQPTQVKGGPGAGAVGVDAGKVAFLQAGACGKYASRDTDAAATLLKSAVSAALGRPVDKIAASYRIGTMGLPSGEDLTRDQKGELSQGGVVFQTGQGTFVIENGKKVRFEDNDQDRPKADMMRYHPQGVITYDPAKVVANGPVVAYEVLPQEAGLIQLVESGHLTRTSDGYYAIEKTFPYFPAGLNGAHGVKFLLRKGVEMPGGSPGHSSVVNEETGECMTRICR